MFHSQAAQTASCTRPVLSCTPTLLLPSVPGRCQPASHGLLHAGQGTASRRPLLPCRHPRGAEPGVTAGTSSRHPACCPGQGHPLRRVWHTPGEGSGASLVLLSLNHGLKRELRSRVFHTPRGGIWKESGHRTQAHRPPGLF